MKKYHEIKNIIFKNENIILTIDGAEKRFAVNEISTALANASEKERNTYEISPSGYGVHWPLIDEDISIDALLGTVHYKTKKRKTA